MNLVPFFLDQTAELMDAQITQSMKFFAIMKLLACGSKDLEFIGIA